MTRPASDRWWRCCRTNSSDGIPALVAYAPTALCSTTIRTPPPPPLPRPMRSDNARATTPSSSLAHRSASRLHAAPSKPPRGTHGGARSTAPAASSASTSALAAGRSSPSRRQAPQEATRIASAGGDWREVLLCGPEGGCTRAEMATSGGATPRKNRSLQADWSLQADRSSLQHLEDGSPRSDDHEETTAGAAVGAATARLVELFVQHAFGGTVGRRSERRHVTIAMTLGPAAAAAGVAAAAAAASNYARHGGFSDAAPRRRATAPRRAAARARSAR